PRLLPAPALTIREGDPVHLQLVASDPDGDDLSYSSALLPARAQFNPTTGLSQWTPGFFQQGEYKIPFTVSDGQAQSTMTPTITVLNANAAPQFDDPGTWIVQEGQQVRFRAFARDPDNPGFIPQDRTATGALTPL